MVTRILIVERVQSQRPSFAEALNKRYEVITASSGKQAITLANEFAPSVIVLDAISMRTPGDRICQQLRDNLPNIPLIHLHPGQKGEATSCGDVMLLMPFTARKLTNVIERYSNHNVVAPRSYEGIVCGPFTLTNDRRLLVFHGREALLTPKLAQLIELFLQHPGQTLERKFLMESVWNTNYLGDTRTLDVHIHQFRAAIEDNPRKPMFLKTVRGKGYRLEIPTEPEPVAIAEAQLALP
jgi:DNA-binding response OmpR family regulator